MRSLKESMELAMKTSQKKTENIIKHHVEHIVSTTQRGKNGKPLLRTKL